MRTKTFCFWEILAISIAIVVTTSVIAATQQPSLVSSSDIIYVPDDHAKIQWAIDNASAGDTIIVKSGTYYENVNVNKQLILRGIDTGTGKPVVDAGGSGNAITLSADGITLDGFDATNSKSGMEIAGIKVISNSNTIKGNNACKNYHNGIYLYASDNNTITCNTVNNNNNGIYLYASGSNNITGNDARNNDNYGIWLYSSSNNTITCNDASNNYHFGIILRDSSNNNNISGNTVSDTTFNDGIRLWVSCNNNKITGNTVTNSNERGIRLWVSCNNNKITSNTVSNNCYGICLDSSSNSTVTCNTANNNYWQGIDLSYSSNSTITCNTANNNYDIGISLGSSSNCTITCNTASNNSIGIMIYTTSNNNKIYLNNFMDNVNSFYSYGSTNNIWNSAEKITYTYKGATYENYTGNYWDDYTGSDAESDGIGDTPYSINTDNDNYPLMEPWENYFAPTGNIFDTGAPSNPYPSIMGNHTGTIKPNHTVIATKLYTYPCEGTGGHTEYACIRNKTWNATATWKGYAGDWHNISFDKTVVLVENETYNYTIRTGSYPQIHHNKTLTVPDGEITCIEFIDANGKKYDDWIPAIKLVCN